MTTQISWGHIGFMLYLAVALTCMVIIHPYARRTSKDPTRATVIFGIYWPLHTIPCLSIMGWRKLRAWKREYVYAQWKRRAKKRMRTRQYVTIRR